MRFLTLILLTAVVVSCTPITGSIPSRSEFRSIDLSRYSEKDFLFTPGDYSGEYESVGLFEYQFLTSSKINSSENENEETYYYWVDGDYSIQQAIDTVYINSLKLGSNAVMNLKVEYVKSSGKSTTHSSGASNSSIKDYVPSGIVVSGFAIKRK